MQIKSLALAALVPSIVIYAGGQTLESGAGTARQNEQSRADGGDSILHSGDSTLNVHIGDGPFGATRAELLGWVQTGAKAVSNYLGKFPVERVKIVINADGDGNDIHGAEFDGRLLRLGIGRGVGAKDLADDWTMTHEMLHLAFPDMGDAHLWMNEGLSVYLEPVARARIGIVSPTRYWRELVEGLHNGQPEPGDKGLDQTHTWGRTYWGGTIFWFLVDAEVREQTHGRKSIDDIVKTILAAGGDGSQSWPMQRVLDAGDKATGTHVMHDVYALLAPQSKAVNFAPWWNRLGVRYANGDVKFDDTAPLAWMRKAIISPDGHGTP